MRVASQRVRGATTLSPARASRWRSARPQVQHERGMRTSLAYLSKRSVYEPAPDTDCTKATSALSKALAS
jgi:hypothetical protein